MTGSRELEVGALNLDLDYALKISAGLSAGFRIAGDFDLEARAGTSPNFVRFLVRKSRESEFNFAADFGVDAEVHLKGLPDTSDEFLSKAFGANAESVLKLFGKARTYSNLDELEKAAGKLASGAVHDVAGKLIDGVLDNTSLGAFLTRIRQVADIYNNLDSRIVHLYEDFLDRLPQLTTMLDRLAEATIPDDLKSITDPAVVALLNRLAGPGIFDVLLDGAAFNQFAKLIQDARSFLEDQANSEVRDVIARLKGAFPLDALLKRLDAVATPDQLKNLADKQLQGLTEKLLGKTFEEIRKSNVAGALRDIHATIEKVASFKEKYYKKVVEAANRSYSAQVNFAFARASASTALLDVEVDVSTAEGSRLARLAAGGDFADLLAAYNSRIVRLNKGVFTHSVSSSTHLQINLLGYGVEGFTRVFQETEDALETHDGGLLHIYTTKTQIEQRKKHGGELTASTFLFASVAKALQPEGSREYLIRTLPKMSVQYDLLQEDDKTRSDEMHQILEFAELLGIVNATAFTDQLRSEFPNGLGKVSARYTVRYDTEGVNAAFQIQDGPGRENLQELARKTMRAYISAKYTTMKVTDHMAAVGFAYNDPQTADIYRQMQRANFVQSSLSLTPAPLVYRRRATARQLAGRPKRSAGNPVRSGAHLPAAPGETR